ncbi:MAG: TlpA family protein disulfide reductase [Deltaproteobacteria bacterium]|nr:TlpA family protein disulfide reductase [Deltaproteobacteria bacterium]MBW2601932.1 TlpA family protein disulfide reductase [Deltaproteobacteria bacterium]
MFQAGSVAAQSPPEVGGLLPEIDLSIPKDPEQRNYLGLTGEGSFKIPQIEAQVVIVEIFSMYCPHCQREAPRVNEFFQLMAKHPKLKDRVKLIGIGIGNSVFEVDVFRKNYKVPFPLFADGDFSIHKILGEVRTPYFIGVKIKDDGGHEVFYSKLGGFEKAGDFLQLMMKLSGLQ